jgi:hypothetical protein
VNLDMRPNQSLNDQLNQRAVNAVHLRYTTCLTAGSVPILSNIFYLSFSQLRGGISSASGRFSLNQFSVFGAFGKQTIGGCVFSVLCPSAIFKIVQTIVELVRIAMVNLSLILLWLTKKGHSNEAMYAEVFRAPVVIKAYPIVSILYRWLTDSGARFFALPRGFESAQARNLIARIAWYVTPFFAFKFFSGKLWSSHDLNLRHRLVCGKARLDVCSIQRVAFVGPLSQI